MKKKKGTAAIGYMLLFGIALILVIVTMYLAETAKLMTHQHDIDDALAESTLASLVADDKYYFETWEGTGTAVVRFRNRDQSWRDYRDCMQTAVGNTTGFFYNFHLTEFIEYEVEGSTVRITTYSGDNGVRTESYGSLGSVRTPDGRKVERTSAYARADFAIKSILDGSYIPKSRDIYCTLEVNDQM